MDENTFKEMGTTAEVMGVSLSVPALKLMRDDLADYPDHKIRSALKRLRQESGRFSVKEIVNRMPGMWPTAEIAWAKAPRDEYQTFITTREALAAWDVASEQDAVSGRMAFKESYDQRVSEAKASGQSPEWIVSLGRDVALRDQVVLDAVRDGLLPPNKALKHLPHMPIGELQLLAGGNTTTHALLEHHQPVVNSMSQLMAPDAPVCTMEENREAMSHLKCLVEHTPVGTTVFHDAYEEHKRLVALEMESLKRLHR